MLLTATVTCAAIGWTLLFYVSLRWLTPQKLTSSDRIYWASTVVSTVHALFSGLSAAYLLGSGALPAWERFGEPSAAWERVIALSFGYFIYDGLLVLSDPAKLGGAQMLLHHFLGLSMHFAPVCVYHKFHALSCLGYLVELSTPFVNARWMLKEAGGGSGTRLYLCNGLAILVTFFAFRVVGLVGCLYQIFVLVPRHAPPSFADLGPTVQYLVPAGALVFYALNLFWFYKIIAGVLKLLRPAKPPGKAAGAGAPPQQAGAAGARVEAYPIKSQ